MTYCYRLNISVPSGDSYILAQTLESFDFLDDRDTRLSDTVIMPDTNMGKYTIYTLRKEVALETRRALLNARGITPGSIKRSNLIEQRRKNKNWAWQIPAN